MKYEVNGLRNVVQTDLRRREREALREGNKVRLVQARRELAEIASEPPCEDSPSPAGPAESGD